LRIEAGDPVCVSNEGRELNVEPGLAAQVN